MPAFKLTNKQAQELDQLVGDYERTKDALREWLDDLAADWESALEDRSERWHESDAGQRAKDRTDTVRIWADELPEGEPNIDAESLQD